MNLRGLEDRILDMLDKGPCTFDQLRGGLGAMSGDLDAALAMLKRTASVQCSLGRWSRHGRVAPTVAEASVVADPPKRPPPALKPPPAPKPVARLERQKTLPAGLALDMETGTVSGTPTEPGTVAVSIPAPPTLEVSTMAKKNCRICGKPKDVETEFAKAAGCKDGHAATCKECSKTTKNGKREKSGESPKARAVVRELAPGETHTGRLVALELGQDIVRVGVLLDDGTLAHMEKHLDLTAHQLDGLVAWYEKRKARRAA